MENNNSVKLGFIWRNNVMDICATESVSEVAKTVGDLLEEFKNNGPKKMSFNFINDEEKINTIHLLAVLRSLFRWKNEIESYSNATKLLYEKIKKTQSEEKAKKILKGLI